MSVRLFVGGLAFSTSTEGLREAFARFGTVTSAAVMTDRETGRSRGFGFVEMGNDDEAERAMGALNGSSLDGRMIRVDKATPRGTPRAAGAPPRPSGPRPWTPRPPSSGSGDQRGGFGGDSRGSGAPADRGWTGRPDAAASPSRRGQRRGPPGPGGDSAPGARRPPSKRTPSRKLGGRDKGTGRGRPGSDGEYRWGR
jgi:RNA recognition motif-containing protein